MSAKVSSFINVNARGYRHVFMLVAWNEYAWAVRDEMNRQAEAFGKDLGEHGLFLRSEEHTSELQSLTNLVCRLLLEKKKDATRCGRTDSWTGRARPRGAHRYQSC